jgi:formate dehydrogenase subunit gamma
MASASGWDQAEAQDIVDRLKSMAGATLPILHALQNHFGYVDHQIVPVIAKATNLSQAEIHGVLTFYHEFRHHPPGQSVIKLCRAEACQSMHCRDLEAHAQQKLGIGWGETTADRRFTLEPVYCLGNCALSPAVMIDGELHGRVDAARFDALIGAAP